MTQKAVSLKNVEVGDIVQAANGTRYEVVDNNVVPFLNNTHIIRGVELGGTCGYYRHWNVDGYHVERSELDIVSIEHKRRFKVGDKFEYTSGMAGIVFIIQSIINDSDSPYVIVGVNKIGTVYVQMMNEYMKDMNGNELEPHVDDPLGFKTAKVGDIYINGNGDELYFIAINPYLNLVYLHSESSGTFSCSMNGWVSIGSSKLNVIQKKEVSNDSSK